MKISKLIDLLKKVENESGDIDCYNVIHAMDAKVEYDEDSDTQYAEVENLKIQFLCNFEEDTNIVTLIDNEDIFNECKNDMISHKKICVIL